MTEAKLMLGNEAIARGAYEAGVRVSAAYPGTPSTEINESLAHYSEVYCEWSSNEKTALETAMGASLCGVRAMASMKQVGINVASDTLYTAAYTGVNAGLVIVVADDPGIYSSQNEQDTRCVAKAAKIPVLEPSDCCEAKSFMKKAFEYSEEYDTPVIVRITTRLAHSREKVILEPRIGPEDKPYIKDVSKNVMLPVYARERRISLEEHMKRLEQDCSDFEVNNAEYSNSGTGIITSGIAYQYVKEALPNASVLKLGIVNPLPKKLIMEFSQKTDRLYVIEELEPVIEEQLHSWGFDCTGKELFPLYGEYSTSLIRQLILNEQPKAKELYDLPKRSPSLCYGCPHRSIFSLLKQMNYHVAGDIGCYTFGALPPFEVIDSVVCMGAGISMLHGIEKAKGHEYIKDWVAVIGDSTFLHTGINGLINMVYNKSAGTVIVLDNGTTAMTGHQNHAGTGLTLQNEKVNPISIAALCRSMGISDVYEIDAYDKKQLQNRLTESRDSDSITVIIAQAPCILRKRF